MSDWQPIETAPKDQTILLYRPTASSYARIAPGEWDDQRHHARPTPHWMSWHRLALVSDNKEHSPTHWMPLPEPPK